MIPRPRPGFLDTCISLGYIYGEKRWRSRCGAYLYTWDSFHGEVEVYTKIGDHFGVADGITGVIFKKAVRGRTIDV